MSRGKWKREPKEVSDTEGTLSSTGQTGEIVAKEEDVDIKAAVKECVDAKFRDLESRVQEIENYRNPNTVDLRVNKALEQVDELTIQVNRLNAEMKKVTDLLRKSFNYGVNEPKPAIVAAAQPRVPIVSS